MRVIAIATIGLVITGAAVAQEQKPAPPNTAAAPSVNEAAPVVNAEADRALKEMGAYIASAEQFTFHADITFDHVLPSGQKLQYSASEGCRAEAARPPLYRMGRRPRQSPVLVRRNFGHTVRCRFAVLCG